MREVLHEDEALTVALEVLDEEARIVMESGEGGPDLSITDEVVVVVDGVGCELEVESPRRATARLPEPEVDDPAAVKLLIRVHEFFEGWEFFGDDG